MSPRCSVEVMTEPEATRSFAIPVAFLLAGVVLGLLTVMWLVLGTGPFISDDEASTAVAPSRPWLPLTAGVLSLAALWAGIRALGRPSA